jgi:hypothetical protein
LTIVLAEHRLASMQVHKHEMKRRGAPAKDLSLTSGLCALLVAIVFLASSLCAQALTPLRDPKDTALLVEAKAACAALNFPRFLRAFAASHIVRNAYTAEEVRLSETRTDAEGRRRTTSRAVLRLAFNGFPLRYADGGYELAPGPGAREPLGRFNEARVQFVTPRRIIGETVVRWSADRGRLSSQGHESAAMHGYTGDFMFVGDGSCWRLTRVRAIHQP